MRLACGVGEESAEVGGFRDFARMMLDAVPRV